ncbi:LysR family transcriptional regulator [Flavisphingomonas formosensis]|uniref:LysR family transcriptional regulator n=1 Tax=Flavisphingomonas formosensis TaxID=861534 RepID=UPI0012FCAB1A|nr:LysR family transcriptional regulator [Sphingomonas formosensis]
MQTRFLEYFVALAREKHFARAAEACHVSQPTLSAGIAALESLLGKRLVVRSHRFVDLTPEGHAILDHARRILAEQDGLRQAIGVRSGPMRGEVRLGAIPAAMPLTGAVLRALHAEHPAVTVRLHSMTSREIERGLIDYELDAGLTYLDNEPPAQVRATPLFAERYVFAAAAGSAYDRPEISWRDAAAAPLCLLHAGMQNRRILDAHLAMLGLAVTPVATADSYVALLSMVIAGDLCSIVTDSHRGLVAGNETLRLIEFVDPAPTNNVGLIILDRQPAPPLATAVFEAVQRLGAFGS